MKFAILSDIHGNSWALAAVLEDARRRVISRFINLGDVLYGPLKPLETYRLLKTIDAVTIQGNEDRDVYEFESSQNESHPTLTYMLKELGKEPVQWLRALPKTAIIDEAIFACLDKNGARNNGITIRLHADCVDPAGCGIKVS